MRAYIDGVLHDSMNDPIVLILSDKEKKQIADMRDEAKMFCSYNMYEHNAQDMVNHMMDARTVSMRTEADGVLNVMVGDYDCSEEHF